MRVSGAGVPLVTSWLAANSMTVALAMFEIQRFPLASKANPAGLCSAFPLSVTIGVGLPLAASAPTAKATTVF